MTSLPRHRHGLRGLSLTELLVVIVIIAVLSALLLPIGTRLREMSRSSACMANMRQVGVAMQLYQSDHNGEAVAAYNVDTRRFWYHDLLGINVDGDVIGPNYISGGVVPKCPSWDQTISHSQSGGYGMTDLTLWNPVRRVHDEPRFYISKLTRPSEWPVLMDADDAVIYGLDKPEEDTPARQRYAARHMDRANVMMADMHIEHVPYGDVRWNQKTLNTGNNF